MAVLLALISGTTLAMLLLVRYGNYLFEDNRTRVSRGRSAEHRGSHAARVGPAADEVQWRTLVDPVEAANRALASKPFVAAYARAMAAEDNRAA